MQKNIVSGLTAGAVKIGRQMPAGKELMKIFMSIHIMENIIRYTETHRIFPVKAKVDVLVCGGRSGGIGAALGAAKGEAR